MAVMAKQVHISGIDKVLGNLNRQIVQINGRSRVGLRAAALLVLGEAKELTPVVTGHLQGFTHTEPIESSAGPGIEIGFDAIYAVFVHERTELHHPVGQAKFLETALKKNAKRVLEIIRKTANT